MSFCCCPNSEEEDAGRFLDLVRDTEIPVKNRKRTDFQCFIVLAVYFSALVICVSVAGGQGDIRRFIHGYDDRGNLCGVKNDPVEGIYGSGLDLTDKKFLQVTERCEYDRCSTERECVNKCEDQYVYFFIPRCVMRGVKLQEQEEKNIISEYKDHKTETKGTTRSVSEMIYHDISLCWKEIVVLCFCSIGLSGSIMTVLRMYPKIVVKIIIIITSIAAIGVTATSWIMMTTKAIAMNSTYGETGFTIEMEMLNWLYIAIFFSVVTATFFFMLYKLRNKIKLIAVVFEEAGKCINDVPTMLLQPVLNYLITAVFACFVCYGIVCFQTSGKAEVDAEGKVSFPDNMFFQIATWLLFFAFLWISQFFLACQNLVIAGSVSSWYFSRVKGKLYRPVWSSFKMIVKHHLGSAAFGSLLIAILKAIRIITRMMERESRKNGLAALIWGLFQCFLACLESILRILNKSAYVMIVLFGQPFCSSARKAFACLTADCSKIAVIIGAGTFILTSIQLLITATVTFVGVALFMNIDEIEVVWDPAILVFILSYLCCHCFFSVYEMAVDTLVLCFCVDHQMNDGLEKPYYMNQNLMILFNEDDRRNSDDVNMDEVADNKMLIVA